MHGLAVLSLLAGLAALAQTQPATAPAGFEIARTHEFAIATPTGFERKPQSGPTMIMHVGNESTDESGRPMRCGLTVERMPERWTGDVRAAAEQIVDRFRREGGFEIIGQPVVESITLSDGTPAAMLCVEAYRGPERRTVIGKIIAGEGNVSWVVSGFVTAGRSSKLAGADGQAYAQIRRHLLTFTLDPEKLDASELQEPQPPASQPE